MTVVYKLKCEETTETPEILPTSLVVEAGRGICVTADVLEVSGCSGPIGLRDEKRLAQLLTRLSKFV